MMGFDKHFYEDHCYSDDPSNDIGLNVVVIEDDSQVEGNTDDVEISPKGYQNQSNNMSTTEGDMNESSKKATSHLYADCCLEHSNMFLFEDETLVKPGDKFNSHDDFVQYLNEKAKGWHYYYKCSDSRKPNTENETYTYNCVYLKNKERYKKKGLRKRNNNLNTDCPCKIKIRHLPNERELTVVYVCNHHDHELSLEKFNKLQHGRRLPPYIKEEILDLLTLQVDKRKIKKYVEMETGLSMSRPFFYALEKNLEKSNNQRKITEERWNMLNEKILAISGSQASDLSDAVEEQMYANGEENHQETEECEDQTKTPPTSKPKPVTGKDYRIRDCAKNKRRTEATDEVAPTDCPKKAKVDVISEINDTVQNVETLQQDSVRCEIQANPWVSDQCVPVLRNRTEDKKTDDVLLDEEPNPVTENGTYRLEYYNPDDNTLENDTQEVYELTESIDDSNIPEDSDDNVHGIAYETVVIDENDVTQNETQEYVDISEVNDEQITIYNDDSQEVINCPEFENAQDIIQVENIQYVDHDNEQLVAYIDESNEGSQVNMEEQSGNDIGLQTANDTGQKILPVFDVYMKDGNVTGFVLNNNLVNSLKDGVEKGIQTSEDIMYDDIHEIETAEVEIIQDENSDTYTKHEFVHRYNIDHYMNQPQFPKYVDILAKETYTNVLTMFTDVYNEKAMFKLITTQKGNEGNTRICYVTHTGRKLIKKKKDEQKGEELGKKLHSIFVLKEKLRNLQKQNDALVRRNRYLEEVALKLVKIG